MKVFKKFYIYQINVSINAIGAANQKNGLNAFRHKNSEAFVKARRDNELSIDREEDDLELFLEEEKRAYNEMKQNPDQNPIVELIASKTDGKLVEQLVTKKNS